MYLVEKEGFGGLTMSKIAKQAQLAIGTLYIYFESKELLINALYLNLQESATSRFFASFDLEASFEERIKTFWMNYFNHRLQHHDESIFLEQYYRSPYITEEQRAIANDMKKPVIELIQKGQEEGVIVSTVPASMVFYMLLGFIREFVDEHFVGNYPINDDMVENAFKLSWRAIKA